MFPLNDDRDSELGDGDEKPAGQIMGEKQAARQMECMNIMIHDTTSVELGVNHGLIQCTEASLALMGMTCMNVDIHRK